jgi:hypothetical protein
MSNDTRWKTIAGNIEALRDVNSLAASIALKKNLMATLRLSLI